MRKNYGKKTGFQVNGTPKFETYVESWQSLANIESALNLMTITPSTTIDIAFASFNFSWGGTQL